MANDMTDRARKEASVAKGSAASIRDWPENERPRERLIANGAKSLTDAELLAIFLRTGLPGLSAIDLARHALQRFGGVTGLLSATPDSLASVKGIGPAKSTQLLAIFELARRALAEDLRRDVQLDSPTKVREYLRLTLGSLPHEVFLVLFLDAQNRLIASEELSRGTLTQASVYPREVAKRALAHNAAAVVLAHNHPSGLAEPSRADEVLTAALRQALQLIDVRVLDHLVVTHSTATSFAERGLL
jgi:DNA repair protein RadC